jgi:nucleotide-binding universal stress UspA family protein
MKILLAVDGSAFSAKACRFAIRLIRALRKTPVVTLIHVDAPLSNSVVVGMGADQAKLYHAENAEYALKPARAALKRAGIACREEKRIGDPGAVIAEFAGASKADLVVMGSHGRTALKNLVMGSVATKVIAASAVPVAVVR